MPKCSFRCGELQSLRQDEDKHRPPHHCLTRRILIAEMLFPLW
nr:MAG TPA: hypothetical protein [Caudoviricetes sp.]